jgi:Flp pilus assembly protein TadG
MRGRKQGSGRRGSERGAAAVEFALVIPVFLMLVLGTIDFGYYFFVSEVVTNAAREGARAATVLDPTTTAWGAARTEAETVAGKYLASGGLKSVGVSANRVPDGLNVNVQVDILYPVGSVTGFFSTIMPTYSKAHAVMRWQ